MKRLIPATVAAALLVMSCSHGRRPPPPPLYDFDGAWAERLGREGDPARMDERIDRIASQRPEDVMPLIDRKAAADLRPTSPYEAARMEEIAGDGAFGRDRVPYYRHAIKIWEQVRIESNRTHPAGETCEWAIYADKEIKRIEAKISGIQETYGLIPPAPSPG